MGRGETIFWGIISGSIGTFLVMGIVKYWRYRTIKGIKRRIRNIEEYRLILDSVAESERAILLFSFMRLFACLALGSLIFLMKSYLSLSELFLPIKFNLKLIYFADVCAGVLICGLLLQAYNTLNKLTKYPESIESINRQIADLNARLSRFTGNRNVNE
jgi:hypothetical protein